MKCEDTHVFSYNENRCVCPKETPFEFEGKCIRCVEPQYWNFINKRCENCPLGTHFSIESQGCEACPSQTPLWNGKYCVKCPENTVYDKQSGKCYGCPDGFRLRSDGSECVPALGEYSA
jgi:hypothetical protein